MIWAYYDTTRTSEPFRVDVTLANIPEGKAWVLFIDDDKLRWVNETGRDFGGFVPT